MVPDFHGRTRRYGDQLSTLNMHIGTGSAFEPGLNTNRTSRTHSAAFGPVSRPSLVPYLAYLSPRLPRLSCPISWCALVSLALVCIHDPNELLISLLQHIQHKGDQWIYMCVTLNFPPLYLQRHSCLPCRLHI